MAKKKVRGFKKNQAMIAKKQGIPMTERGCNPGGWRAQGQSCREEKEPQAKES